MTSLKIVDKCGQCSCNHSFESKFKTLHVSLLPEVIPISMQRGRELQLILSPLVALDGDYVEGTMSASADYFSYMTLLTVFFLEYK